ncbi:hypothetical protein N7497_012133 [Penicillium chrysogenum]|nr:hypothetical protein N7497_012133 [Penicillium chrysogenum]
MVDDRRTRDALGPAKSATPSIGGTDAVWVTAGRVHSLGPERQDVTEPWHWTLLHRGVQVPHKFLLCGRRERVGSLVIEELKPEYEVIHFITSVEDGTTNLPLILSGNSPKREESSLGSKIYSQPPKAVIFGGGYDDEAIEKLRQAVAGSQRVLQVPWLKADLKKSESGPPPGTEAYCTSAAARMRESLKTLEITGRMNGNEDEIFFW